MRDTAMSQVNLRGECGSFRKAVNLALAKRSAPNRSDSKSYAQLLKGFWSKRASNGGSLDGVDSALKTGFGISSMSATQQGKAAVKMFLLSALLVLFAAGIFHLG